LVLFNIKASLLPEKSKTCVPLPSLPKDQPTTVASVTVFVTKTFSFVSIVNALDVALSSIPVEVNPVILSPEVRTISDPLVLLPAVKT